jgi:formylglycine-generating enzyme required for sulfatase activity
MRVSSAAPSTDLAQQARTMGRDGLSVALIDARNATLRWLSCFEEQGHLLGPAVREHGAFAPVPLHMAGRMGWLQEWWITRHLRRLQPLSAGATGARLASLDARMDEAFSGNALHFLALQDRPAIEETRSYLEATLEQTLERLSTCPAGDDALTPYRCALLREDRLSESMAVAAQALGASPGEMMAIAEQRPTRVSQDPVWMPAQRVQIGSARSSWAPAHEQWAHEVDLPECEIDAQAVSWERFVEFAEDGGYDRQALWHPEGWDWVQAQSRRAPRYVEQLRQGVLLHRFGVLQRASGRQAACHLSWYEADAWCRWAGRRLPTEVEWEAAAVTAGPRGWQWGDVWEWVASTARPWPQGPALAGAATPRRVLRGASVWTSARAAHPRQRRFVVADRDELFAGFRSCAA